MTKIQKLQNKISQLEIKIMSIKINTNTYYSTTIPQYHMINYKNYKMKE